LFDYIHFNLKIRDKERKTFSKLQSKLNKNGRLEEYRDPEFGTRRHSWQLESLAARPSFQSH